MTHLVADQLTNVHGPRLKLQRLQNLRGRHTAEVGENCAVPGQGQDVPDQHANLHRP